VGSARSVGSRDVSALGPARWATRGPAVVVERQLAAERPIRFSAIFDEAVPLGREDTALAAHRRHVAAAEICVHPRLPIRSKAQASSSSRLYCQPFRSRSPARQEWDRRRPNSCGVRPDQGSWTTNPTASVLPATVTTSRRGCPRHGAPSAEHHDAVVPRIVNPTGSLASHGRSRSRR